jgi:ABC-type nitrate/sulfonate/bicarbonate transport system permease component
VTSMTIVERLMGRGGPEADEPVAAERRLSGWLAPVATTIVVIVLFDLTVRSGLVLRRAFVTVPELVQGLYDEVQTGSFWHAVGLTMEGWAFGLGLAIVVAIPVGIAIGTTPAVYHSLRFVIDFLRPIPSIALIPLFIIIFGITLRLKIYLIAIGAFWPLLFQTMYGVQDVDPVARDTARAYGLNPVMRFIFVFVPGATPYIATGLRISATYALLTAVGTELLVGVPGIGAEIFTAQQSGHTKAMYALIVASGLIGLLISYLFTRLERVTLRWHPSQRGEQ